MPFMPTTALASGVQRQSETQAVTTDPDTFTVQAVFDCVLPTIATLTIMGTVFTPDGETFGVAPGDIQGIQAGNFEVSVDGTGWTPILTNLLLQDYSNANALGGLSSPGEFDMFMIQTPRYLRFTLGIVDDSYAPYAGPNHPTVTFAVSALWV